MRSSRVPVFVICQSCWGSAPYCGRFMYLRKTTPRGSPAGTSPRWLPKADQDLCIKDDGTMHFDLESCTHPLTVSRHKGTRNSIATPHGSPSEFGSMLATSTGPRRSRTATPKHAPPCLNRNLPDSIAVKQGDEKERRRLAAPSNSDCVHS
jgi:hypothetical protein